MEASEPVLAFEALKFRRAPVVRTVSILIGAGLPVLAAAFMVAATSGGAGQLQLKAAAMLTGAGWSGYLAMVGMILSVGALLGIGFVVCWCFGREFTEKREASLFGLPVGRRRIAYAKFAVILLWSLALCLACMAVSLLAGLVIGLGLPGPEALGAAAKAWFVGVLAALLACPFAVMASMARGYLPGVGGLVLLIVITQVVTAFGGGAWFPYAAPTPSARCSFSSASRSPWPASSQPANGGRAWRSSPVEMPRHGAGCTLDAKDSSPCSSTPAEHSSGTGLLCLRPTTFAAEPDAHASAIRTENPGPCGGAPDSSSRAAFHGKPRRHTGRKP
ncbi:hypothetical protein GCM10009628_26460 [Paeniglutamicibacter kerguelensis]